MRGAILQITVNNNLPPSAPLPSLKQCFIAFSSICICHPRGPLFDLSPPVPASPGSRWPVDWQLWSDIWWDEASTTAPWRGEKRADLWVYCSPPPTAITSFPEQRAIRRSPAATRCRKVQANGQSMSMDVSVFFDQGFFFFFVRVCVRAYVREWFLVVVILLWFCIIYILRFIIKSLMLKPFSHLYFSIFGHLAGCVFANFE